VWRNGKEQRGAKARKAYRRMVHSNTGACSSGSPWRP
jgi:hypothetical protein